MTNQEKIADFLNNLTLEEIANQSDLLIWIDWREAEEDLIGYFNDQLPVSNRIACEVIEIDKPRGVDIILSSQEKTITIPFADDVTDRDSAIRAMQGMLSPQYQIRWFMETLGDDTLAFALLPTIQWEELELQFGKRKVDYYFQPITNTSTMFEMGMDAVVTLLKSREEELPNI
ncbi:hypothetical protein [Bacillus ndiopicus]|uniref:hypothetical protein n=1 Tax=Bacillus ndiopicus TaxID=1347368 RepID=UPI0006946349|nr:hypothetical protein [Bacillus ndiopicus]